MIIFSSLPKAALAAEREKQQDVRERSSQGEARAQEPKLLWQLERVQKQADDLREERQALLRDVALLEDTLERMKDRSESLTIMMACVLLLPWLQPWLNS